MQDLLVELIGTIVAPASAVASPLAGKRIDQVSIHPVYIASVLVMAISGAYPPSYETKQLGLPSSGKG